MGSRRADAASRADGRRPLPRLLGGHRRLGPDDRLQLVRLRHAAAAATRQHPGRVCAGPDPLMLSLFQAIEFSTIGQAIKTSSWAFAVIESVHLLALAAIGGSVLLVDLRLLGLGLKRQTVAEVARDAQPVFAWSLAVMLSTGFALFVSEAIK